MNPATILLAPVRWLIARWDAADARLASALNPWEDDQ